MHSRPKGSLSSSECLLCSIPQSELQKIRHLPVSHETLLFICHSPFRPSTSSCLTFPFPVTSFKLLPSSTVLTVNQSSSSGFHLAVYITLNCCQNKAASLSHPTMVLVSPKVVKQRVSESLLKTGNLHTRMFARRT